MKGLANFMLGDAWAVLATKIFSWTTDTNGLKLLQTKLAIERKKKEITDAIKRKDYAAAAQHLTELQRMSDAA
jgi:hypothetical protein